MSIRSGLGWSVVSLAALAAGAMGQNPEPPLPPPPPASTAPPPAPLAAPVSRGPAPIATSPATRLPPPMPPAASAPAPVPTARPELMADPTALPPIHVQTRPTMLPERLPERQTPAQLVFSADYKFLRPRREADHFAIVDPNTDDPPEGPIESHNAGFDSGFRVRIGYRPAGSPWEAGFAYSFFRTRDSQLVTAPGGGLLFPTLTRPGLIDEADSADATTRWRSDLYDIELGRSYAVDSALAVRVRGGVRIADLSQDSVVLYDGRAADLARVFSGFHFVGAGIMIGGESHWTVGRGFSLFGRAGGGLLLGANNSYLRETQNDGATLHSDVTLRSTQTVPVLEMALGASWRYRSLNFRAGYEITNWFQLINALEFPDDMNRGKILQRPSNFSLDGFFVQLGYTF